MFTWNPNAGSGGGGTTPGTSNYNDLSNKPKINGVELRGELSLDDLGIPHEYVDVQDAADLLKGK